MNWTGIALFIQLFFGIVIGMYFLNLLKGQRTQKVSIDRDSRKEMDQLRKMRSILPYGTIIRTCTARLHLMILLVRKMGLSIKGCTLRAESTACYYIWPTWCWKNAAARLSFRRSQTQYEIAISKISRICGIGCNNSQV